MRLPTFYEQNLIPNWGNHYSRKLKADLFIDDRNLGGLPEWGMIYRMIHDKWGYEDIYQSSGNKEETKKRSFWKILFSKM